MEDNIHQNPKLFSLQMTKYKKIYTRYKIIIQQDKVGTMVFTMFKHIISTELGSVI